MEMNLSEFLASGLLELYLLGHLDEEGIAVVEKMRAEYGAEIDDEINALEAFFEQDAFEKQLHPSPAFNLKMQDMFANLEIEQSMFANQLPLISPFSNADDWYKLILSDLPKTSPTERFQKLLRNDHGVMQVLVISQTDIDEEVHEDVEESFLILEGTCTCTIGSTALHMGPGDFMQIPLYLPHKVTLTSPSVTAILQHVQLSKG